MERYKNLGGDSGVVAYNTGNGFIEVQFKDGAIYLYNEQSTGANDVARMQELAIAGVGLNSFISRVVKSRYASKRK